MDHYLLTLRLVLVLLCLLFYSSAAVYAQTPTPTPKSAEVLKLEEEKAQAELRKAIAEANKAELEAKFPKPTTSPLEGKTTVDGALIESQIVSYAEMAKAADKVAGQLKNSNLTINTLAIYNEADIKLILSYKVALNQLKLMRAGYLQLIESNPPACPAEVAGFSTTRALENKARMALDGPIPVMTLGRSIFGSFVDLTALLRTNVEIKGQMFDIDELALVSEVFRAIKETEKLKTAALYYPALFPPNLDFNVDAFDSKLLTELEQLNHYKAYAEGLADALGETQKEIIKTKAAIEALKAEVAGLKARKSEAEDKLADLETVYGSLDGNQRRRIPPEKLEQMLELKRLIDGFQKRLDEIQKTPDGRLAKTEAELKRLRAVIDCLLSKLKPNLQDPEKLEDTIARLKAKNEQFAKFVEALVKADNASGFNSLTSYIKAEIILAALKGAEQKDTNFYWLQLKVLKAGGNNRIKTNLVVDIFTGGNRLSHSGGVVVEYILFDRNGLAKASAIFTEYSGYIKSGDIKKQKKTVKVEQTAGK
jgi:hypothetical protein